MATTHTIGKLSGASQSLTLEVFVHDDGQPPAAIDQDDVVAHINAAGDIPTSILGVPDDGDPQLTQVSNTLWKVGIRYRIASLRPLHPPLTGEERSGFNFHLPRKFMKWADEVTHYPASLPSMGGFINVLPNLGAQGAWLEPPVPNLSKTLSVAPSVVTGSWVRGIAQIVGGGYVNSLALTSGAYEIGTVIITHIVGLQISETLFNIEIGWNWTPNVTGETRGPITDIAYDGQDFVWGIEADNIDRDSALIAKRLKAVYVNRIRPRTDLAAIGISPP